MLGSARKASSLPACGRDQQGLDPLAWAPEEGTQQVPGARALPGQAISTLGNFVGAEAKDLGCLTPGSPDKAAAVTRRQPSVWKSWAPGCARAAEIWPRCADGRPACRKPDARTTCRAHCVHGSAARARVFRARKSQTETRQPLPAQAARWGFSLGKRCDELFACSKQCPSLLAASRMALPCHGEARAYCLALALSGSSQRQALWRAQLLGADAMSAASCCFGRKPLQTPWPQCPERSSRVVVGQEQVEEEEGAVAELNSQLFSRVLAESTSRKQLLDFSLLQGCIKGDHDCPLLPSVLVCVRLKGQLWPWHFPLLAQAAPCSVSRAPKVPSGFQQAFISERL